MVEGSTLEALRDDHALGRGSDGHPALFADHGIVHVRDVAAGVVDLAATVDGILLPRRPADRREFVIGLAVIIAYVHDVGMYDPTPTGRRIHALYGAHLDRKSTRLNSSHPSISYAVFCLKKKKKKLDPRWYDM